MSDDLMQILTNLLQALPILLVNITALILAIVMWRRCPVASFLVVLSSAVAFFQVIVSQFITQYVVRSYAEWGWDIEKMQGVLFWLGIGYQMLWAVSLALMVGAVFIGRRPATSAPA